METSITSKAGRNIPKLVIEQNGLQKTVETAQVPNHMFDHYIQTVTPNPEAGQVSIEQFPGPQLTATMPNAHQSYTKG